MTTLGDMQTKVLSILNKESTYQGFYTTQKVTDAINDSLDYIMSYLQTNNQNGWLNEIVYITTTSGNKTYPLPTGTCIIRAVRYKSPQGYQWLPYDGLQDVGVPDDTYTVRRPMTYRLVGNSIELNRVPDDIGTDYIQIERTLFPAELVASVDNFPALFTRGLENYVKWRSCSVLTEGTERYQQSWSRRENEWYEQLVALCAKRVTSYKIIREFQG